MNRTTTFNKTLGAFAAVAVLGLLAGSGALHREASADGGIPANRMAVTGSNLEVMTAPLTEGYVSENHTLMSGKIKLSSPTDLILRVTLECALWTDITVVGNDDSEAIASVKVWAEIDGVPVSVSPDESEEIGKVVFCNRAFRQVTTNFENDNQTIETYLRTRTANGFNWFAIDIPEDGGNIHTVEIKAQLEAQVTNLGMAQAAIGKRTLVVEPVMLDSFASF